MIPKISIITICFNEQNRIKRTIESVLKQDFESMEYIVKDGKSVDETVSIAESFTAAFTSKCLYKIICEKDAGLYDAMNEAVKAATGEWVLFLNAGDEFVDSKSVSSLFSVTDQEYDIVYGNTLFMEKGLYKRVDYMGADILLKRMPFIHQSTMVKRETLLEYPFKTCYRITADYDYFLEMYLKDKKFCAVDAYISAFELGGLCMTQTFRARMEDRDSRIRHGVERPIWTVLSLINDLLFKWIRNFCRLLLPHIFYSEAQGWYKDRKKAVMQKSL